MVQPVYHLTSGLTNQALTKLLELMPLTCNKIIDNVKENKTIQNNKSQGITLVLWVFWFLIVCGAPFLERKKDFQFI